MGEASMLTKEDSSASNFSPGEGEEFYTARKEIITQLNNFGVACVEPCDLMKAKKYFQKATSDVDDIINFLCENSNSNSCKKKTTSTTAATKHCYYHNKKRSGVVSNLNDFFISTRDHRRLGHDIDNNHQNQQSNLYDEGMDELSKSFYKIPDSSSPTMRVLEITTATAAVTATALYNLGQVYSQANEYEVAMESFSRALRFAQHVPQPQQLWNYDEEDGNGNTKNKICCSESGESSTQTICTGCVSVIRILHSIGNIQYRRGRYDASLRKFNEALAIERDSEIQNSNQLLQIASSLNCLGVIHFHKNELDKALELYLESLTIRRTVLDGSKKNETKEIATTLGNIGKVHYMNGKYDEALRYNKKAYAIRRNVLGNDHLDVAAIFFNLGQTYHHRHRGSRRQRRCSRDDDSDDVGDNDENDMGDDLDIALSYYAKFLEIAKKNRQIHVKHHHYNREITIVLKYMGQIYHEKNLYTEAMELYEEALVLGKSTFGQYHPEIASILNKLGNLFYERGGTCYIDKDDFVSAIRIYKEGLDVERRILDTFHPNIIITLTNIGQVYKLRGKYKEALRYLKEAVMIQRYTLGRSHPNLTASLSSIGMIYYQTNNCTKALDSYQEVLRIYREMYAGDDNHLEVATTLNSIGLVFFKLELYEFSLQSFEGCMNIRSKLLGLYHKDVATVLYNMATVLLDIGNEEEAMKCYIETLRLEKKIASSSSSSCNNSNCSTQKDVINTLLQISLCYQQRGELDDALRYLHDVLAIQKEMSSAEENNNNTKKGASSAIAQTLNRIGNIYLQKGQAKELVDTFSDSIRYLREAGKNDNCLVISGLDFYGLSKIHPECASVA